MPPLHGKAGTADSWRNFAQFISMPPSVRIRRRMRGDSWLWFRFTLNCERPVMAECGGNVALAMRLLIGTGTQ